MHKPEPHIQAREQLHHDLFGRNAFVATMIGVVAFAAACVHVMWT